eukprot:gb/GECG01003742.1/.p1 GENE.gb/GECG01003742.1/~~gb/GECG01003742.1/.p1  ORF type:complete len:563 (+),score=73.29 gb/GECG01003742.1/:1-1689(+)
MACYIYAKNRRSMDDNKEQQSLSVSQIREHIGQYSKRLYQLWSRFHAFYQNQRNEDEDALMQELQRTSQEALQSVHDCIPPAIFVPWWGKLWRRTFHAAAAERYFEQAFGQWSETEIHASWYSEVNEEDEPCLEEPVEDHHIRQLQAWTESLSAAGTLLAKCVQGYWTLSSHFFEMDSHDRELKHRKISPSFSIDQEKVNDMEYYVMTEKQYEMDIVNLIHHQLFPENVEAILRAIYRKSLLVWVRMLYDHFMQSTAGNDTQSFNEYIQTAGDTIQNKLQSDVPDDQGILKVLGLYFGAAVADQRLQRRSSAADIIKSLFPNDGEESEEDEDEDQDMTGDQSSGKSHFLYSVLCFHNALAKIDGHELRSVMISDILNEHIKSLVNRVCREDDIFEDTNLVQTVLEYLRIFVLSWFHCLNVGVQSSYDAIFREMKHRSSLADYWCGIPETVHSEELGQHEMKLYNILFSWEPPKCGTSTPLSSENSNLWTLNRLLLCSGSSSEIWSYMSKLSHVEKQEHGISQTEWASEHNMSRMCSKGKSLHRMHKIEEITLCCSCFVNVQL